MSDTESTAILSREDNIFTKITDRLKKHDGDKTRILSIAIWGWEGSGKTTSVLTYSHYGNALEHGISITYVDVAEMQEVLGESALPHLTPARQTRTSLKPLSETFIDDAQWPLGTDRPTQYLVRVRNRRSKTLGYAYLTDLPGGSYRQNDDTALSILRDAHGAVILVAPERYGGKSVDDREYRDEVEQRISQCDEHSLPTAVMLTKCDKASGISEDILRQAQTNLNLLAEDYKHITIFRTSVIGDIEWASQDEPPPGDERRPEQLVFAWADLLSRAVCLDKRNVQAAPPLDSIQRRNNHRRILQANVVPEVLQLGVWSGCPGHVIAATPRRGGANFITIDSKGQLHEVRIDNGQTATPEIRAIGRLTDPPDDINDLIAQISDGRIFVAPKHDSEHIWVGPLTGEAARFEVQPYSSWTLSPSGTLVISMMNGGVQAINFQPDMKLGAYRKVLTETQDYSVGLAWFNTNQCICACDGENIAFVKMIGDQFDAKIDIPALRPPSNTQGIAGYVTLTSAPMIITEYGFPKVSSYREILQHERTIVATIPEGVYSEHTIRGPWAASTALPLLATISATGKLEVTWVREDDITAAAETSLPTEARSLAFDLDSTRLFAELADGSYAIYTLKGWPHG